MSRVTLIATPANVSTAPRWSAHREEVPGIMGVGNTEEEALADLDRVLQEYNQMAEVTGLPLIDTTRAAQLMVLQDGRSLSVFSVATPAMGSGTLEVSGAPC